MTTNRSTFLLLCGIFSLGTASWARSHEPGTIYYELKLKSASFGSLGTRKMWVKGDKMRWESRSARLPLCLVKNQAGVYLIHPWEKVAAQYPEGSPRGNPRALWPGPLGPTKVFLKAVGATRLGRETVTGRQCEAYSYTDSTTGRNCKIWVDAGSGKPVQLLARGKKGKQDSVTGTYTKFVEGARAADSLFELPRGYAVRPMPKLDLTSDTTAKKHNKKESG